jgi:hypothetical protein
LDPAHVYSTSPPGSNSLSPPAGQLPPAHADQVQPVRTMAPPAPLFPRQCPQAPTAHSFALPTCVALTLAYNHCELHAEGFPFVFSSLRARLVPLLSTRARTAAVDRAVMLRCERPSSCAMGASSTFQPQASSIVIEAEVPKGPTEVVPPPRASVMPACTGPPPASSAPP